MDVSRVSHDDYAGLILALRSMDTEQNPDYNEGRF